MAERWGHFSTSDRVDIRMPDGTVVRNVPRGTPKADIERRWKESKLRKQVEDNPILGPVSSFASGAADMLTLGAGDEIRAGLDTINPFNENSFWRGGSFNDNLRREQAQDEGLKRANPKSNFAGQVAGAVAPAVVSGGATLGQLPRTATASARLARTVAPTAAAAAQGGAYAFNSGKGGIKDRLAEVPEGMAWGAGGDIVGRGLGHVVANTLGGKQLDDAARLLVDEDVLLTPGMRGGIVKRTIEDKVLGSIPGLDEVTKMAGDRSFATLRRAAANRALAPIGRSVDDVAGMADDPRAGQAFNQLLQDEIYGTYDDALEGMDLQLDDDLALALDDVLENARLAMTDENAGIVSRNIDNVKEMLGKGPLTGGPLRDTVQGIRGATAKQDGAVKGSMADLYRVIEDTLDRQSGAGATNAYKNARESVSLLKRIENAASRPGVEAAEYGPTHLKQAVQKRGYGVNDARIAAGQAPMQDLADAAAEVMRIKSANSGTVPRAVATGGLLGVPAMAATVDPLMGGLVAAQTLGYVPGIDKILQNMAVNGMGYRGAADAIRRNNRALGLLGTGSALGIYSQ